MAKLKPLLFGLKKRIVRQIKESIYVLCVRGFFLGPKFLILVLVLSKIAYAILKIYGFL